MWDYEIESLDDSRCQRFILTQHDNRIAYADVLSLWQADARFRSFFKALLAACPYSAFRWETPPITVETADRPFEFVLLNCPALERSVDVAAFDEHFRMAKQSVVKFTNLSGDAILVVPCPRSSPSNYGHLASFVRKAPAEQVDELFHAVGSAMLERLNSRPVWLSTAGMGVAWLHVRLDSHPKYYGHHPYRRS